MVRTRIISLCLILTVVPHILTAAAQAEQIASAENVAPNAPAVAPAIPSAPVMAVSKAPVLRPADFKDSCNRILKKLETTDLGTLASQPAPASSMEEPGDVMERFVVLILAGFDKEAVEFLPTLAKYRVQVLQSGIARELEQSKRWTLLRRYLELFPQEIPDNHLGEFITIWSKTTSSDVISVWLAKRLAEATDAGAGTTKETASPLSRYSFHACSPRHFWMRELFSFAGKHDQLEALVESYRKRVEADPRNDALVIDLMEGSHSWQGERLAPVDWIADIWHPSTACAAYQVGRKSGWKTTIALKLMNIALKMPFTEADREFLASRAMVRQIGSPDRWGNNEKEFRSCIRQELVRLNLAAGNKAEAQKQMELIAADFPDGLPRDNMDLAGITQGITGERVIEKRILVVESTEENRTSPDYWSERCTYYMGRREYQKALDAAHTYLSLTTVPTMDNPKDNGGCGTNASHRSRALWNVSSCLCYLDRSADAIELYRKELAALPPEHNNAPGVAHGLVSLYLQNREKHTLDKDDPQLWAWLDARPDWDNTEARILEEVASMLRGDADKLTALWNRTEALALKNPLRADAAAQFFVLAGEPKRAVNCLEHAFRELPNGNQKNGACYKLFDAYVRSKDFKSAEEMLPKIMVEDSAFNLLESYKCRYESLSGAAAKAGSKEDAMRLWARARGYNRWSNKDAMRPLLDAGLKPELIEYYTALAKKEPSCSIAIVYLKRLNNSDSKGGRHDEGGHAFDEFPF